MQREMRKENKRLNLDDVSDTGPGAPSNDFEKLALLEQGLSVVKNPAIAVDIANGLEEEIVDRQNFSDSDPGDQGLERGHSEQGDSNSDPSELVDEYAPRQDVENRLRPLLGSMDKNTQVGGHALTTTTTSAASDNGSNTLPKLGKAKAKRAKKAARKETDLQNGFEFNCATCSNTFTSRGKLFTHIKELNHAQPVPKANSSKSKKR